MKLDSNNVPVFEEFFNPVLKVLKDQSSLISKSDVIDKVASLMNLSPEVMKIVTKKTNALTYKDRTGWALFYLRRVELISNDKLRGYYEITTKGIQDYPIDAFKISKQLRLKDKEARDVKDEQDLNDKNNLLEDTQDQWKKRYFRYTYKY